MMMRNQLIRMLFLIGMLGIVVACASAPRGPAHTEALLKYSGFTAVPVNTEQRNAWLKALPAYQIKQVQHEGKTVYAYAMPLQQVIYVGGPKQYALYQTAVQQENIAGRDRMAAEAPVADSLAFDALDGWPVPRSF